jgi:hypothetical protein
MPKSLVCVCLLGFGVALASCGGTSTMPTSTAPPTPPVLYSVTGTAKTVEIRYTLPDSSIFISTKGQTLPFTFAWPTPPAQGQLVLLSAEITTAGDTGTVRVSVSENGIETGSDTATGYPNGAQVSIRP